MFCTMCCTDARSDSVKEQELQTGKPPGRVSSEVRLKAK
jgi:hypothetical protein